MGKHLDVYLKGCIDSLRRLGRGYGFIASELNIPVSTVASYCQRVKRRGHNKRKPGSGRPRKTTESQDRYIVRCAVTDDDTSLVKISNLPSVTVSPSTVHNRINEAKLKCVVVRKKLLLTGKAKTARKKWCRAHLNWSNDQWDSILWSDESYFTLKFEGKQMVYVFPGQENSARTIASTDWHQLKIMIWGCFSAHGVGKLYLCEGTMNQHKYMEVIRDYMVPSGRDLFDGEPFIF